MNHGSDIVVQCQGGQLYNHVLAENKSGVASGAVLCIATRNICTHVVEQTDTVLLDCFRAAHQLRGHRQDVPLTC